MAGIFVTYHSTKEIFGFEYIPREELVWFPEPLLFVLFLLTITKETHVFGNSIWASKSYEITLQLLYTVLEEIKAKVEITGSVRLLLYVKKKGVKMVKEDERIKSSFI